MPEIPTESDCAPAGFTADVHPSPFLEHLGPVYWGRDPVTGLLTAGILIDHRHLNSRGGVHGGVLTTLADVVLGHATSATTDPPTPLVTASLTVDYLGSASRGHWLQGRVEAYTLGRTLAFARGVFTADGDPVLQASSVFRVIRPTPPDAH